MKKNHLSGSITILLIGLVLFFIQSCTEKQLVFSRLQVSTDTLKKWHNDSSVYSNLALQHHYDSTQAGRWNLRCYGLRYDSNSATVLYSPNSNTFRMEEDSSTNINGSLTLGNSYIPMGLLGAIIQAATFYSAGQVYFHPVLKTSNDINFIAYYIKIPDTTGKPRYIDSSSIEPKYRHLLKADSTKGFSYFELNPCPPANITLSNEPAPKNN